MAAAVAPTVALLCHEEAPCNGEILSVGAGRTARVTYAVVPGFKSPEPSIESLRDNWDRVMDPKDLVLASSGADDTMLFDLGFDDLADPRINPDNDV